jgi:hypothetical protein
VFSEPHEDFCVACKSLYSQKALAIMRYFGVPLDAALIKAARLFHSAQGISDYFGVSLPTLYAWIRAQHGLSFRQFKRKYVCPSRACIVIDHRAHYAWKYTVADRVHDRGGCICFIEGSDSLIMTTLVPVTVAEILHAEVGLDVETGIHLIRYPLRKRQLREIVAETDREDDADDDSVVRRRRRCRVAGSR